MKVLPLAPVKLLQNSKLCLFGIAVGLSALHLLLTWRVSGSADRLIIGVLFWGALLSLLHRKQDTLNLESGIFSSFFGLFLIALVLLKSISLFWYEADSLRPLPLIAILGLGLLASGIKGLRQYWQELLIGLLLCLPETLFIQIVDRFLQVTTLITQFAVFVLWYLGVEVSRQGVNIILPNNLVRVEAPCVGIDTGILLLKLSVLFILMFPTDRLKKILVLLGATLIAFITGGIRVAVMAGVASNQAAFDYWHGPEGNQIFSTISIIVFGLFCRFLLRSDELANQDRKLQ